VAVNHGRLHGRVEMAGIIGWRYSIEKICGARICFQTLRRITKYMNQLARALQLARCQQVDDLNIPRKIYRLHKKSHRQSFLYAAILLVWISSNKRSRCDFVYVKWNSFGQ
jgi:hypothetical protein